MTKPSDAVANIDLGGSARDQGSTVEGEDPNVVAMTLEEAANES